MPHLEAKNLASAEQMDAQLQRIGRSVSFEPKKFFGKETYFYIPPATNTPVSFSEQDRANYLRDMTDDIKGLRQRIQRLKLLVLPFYLGGILKNKKEEKLSYEDQEKTVRSRMQNTAFELSKKPDEVTDSQKKDLITWLRRIIPKEFQFLDESPDFQASDFKKIYDLLLVCAHGKPPTQKKEEEVRHLLTEIQDLEKELLESQNQGDFFSEYGTVPIGEKGLFARRAEYRGVLKKVASLLEQESWFSPTHLSTLHAQRGPHQHPTPFQTDYQRFSMEELELLEYKMRDTYPPTNHEVVLVNSGMNALETILIFLDEKLKKAEPPILIFEMGETYFECENLIKSRYRGAEKFAFKKFKTTSAENIGQLIKEKLPRVVFLDPLANSFNMKTIDVTKLVSILSDKKWTEVTFRRLKGEKIFIVMDNTTLGKTAQWRTADFSGLPSFVQLISFESLVKYTQDGQDISPAGLIEAIGNDASSLQEDFRSLRGRRGFSPPEMTVRRMETLFYPEALEARMKRHYRNASRFVQTLSQGIQGQKGLISDMIHPSLDPESAAIVNGGASLVNLVLDFNFLEHYQESQQSANASAYQPRLNKISVAIEDVNSAFKILLFKLANEAEVELNQGTSFGFDVTRISTYKRDLEGRVDFSDPRWAFKRDIPYVRVAVGTENTKDILLLSNIFLRANQIFAEAIKEGKLFMLIQALIGIDDKPKIHFGNAPPSSVTTAKAHRARVSALLKGQKS